MNKHNLRWKKQDPRKKKCQQALARAKLTKVI